MQPSGSGDADFQQLWGRWITLLNRLYDDPKVAQVMNSKVGQYLSSHPFFALAVMMFSTMASLPVGLFFTFALVTVLLLSVAGLTLMSVLFGLALFSVLVSVIFNAFYIVIFIILKYYPLTKRGKAQEKESEEETS